MKPRNLGLVRHKQKLWLDKQNAAKLQHRTGVRGEAFCGASFSRNDMGETDECPHCGREVHLVVPLFGDVNFWETKED